MAITTKMNDAYNCFKSIVEFVRRATMDNTQKNDNQAKNRTYTEPFIAVTLVDLQLTYLKAQPNHGEEDRH